MSADQKEQLFNNIKAAMDGVPVEIVKRQVVHFYRADPDYGIGVASRMGKKGFEEGFEQVWLSRDTNKRRRALAAARPHLRADPGILYSRGAHLRPSSTRRTVATSNLASLTTLSKLAPTLHAARARVRHKPRNSRARSRLDRPRNDGPAPRSDEWPASRRRRWLSGRSLYFLAHLL